MPTSLPVAGRFTDPTLTNAQAKAAQNDILAFVRQSVMGTDPVTTLSTASGLITPTKAVHRVDTEGAAAASNLDRIAITNTIDNQFMLLMPVAPARVITVRNAQGGIGQLVLRDGANCILDSVDDFILFWRDGNNWREVFRSVTIPVVGLRTDCRLTRSGANLILNRSGGSQLAINGVNYTIPAAGVTLAPTGAAAATTYYVYAYMNAGVMTLEYSATGYGVNADTGLMTKTGDASRALVGMVYASAAATWGTGNADVASYYNRRPTLIIGNFTASRNVSGLAAEINTEIRNNFLAWGDMPAQGAYNGSAQNATAGGAVYTYIALNGTTPTQAFSGISRTMVSSSQGGGPENVSQAQPFFPNEGRNFTTMVGGGGAAGQTTTWFGSDSVNAMGKLSTLLQL